MSTVNNRFSEGLAFPIEIESIKDKGFVESWLNFFRKLFEINKTQSSEMYFTFKNNLADQKIEGLQFNNLKVNCAHITYFVQRVNYSDGPSSGIGKIESGILAVYYNPRTQTWGCTKTVTSGTNTAGVTFSMNSSGQVLVSSTNETGQWTSGFISKISYHVKTIEAKYKKPDLGWL